MLNTQMMTKLLFFLLLPTLCYGQTKTEDYWVYIKDRAEITSSDRIAGTSQKGDIVEVIPCSRLGKNEPSELEKKEYLIIKVSGITESERNAMLAPYTETKTETQVFETERTITTDEWETMRDKEDYSPFISKPTDVSAEWEAKGNILNNRVAVKGIIRQEVSETTTLAYRKRKIDVDSYKTAQSIDSKTSFVTTAVSKASVVTIEKTASDITAMQREAKLYDRTMPLRQLVKWGWEKILAPAYAANTTHTVITTGGGDYTTLNAYEDAIDGTAYSAGETATVNCSGTSADTTAVVIDGWDADVALYINGNYAVTSGVHYSTSYYRLEVSGSGISIANGQISISKLQIKITPTVNDKYCIGNFWTDGNRTLSIDRCILVGSGTTDYYEKGVLLYTNQGGGALSCTITNSILYNFLKSPYSDALQVNGNHSITARNCTIYNCYFGFERDGGTAVATNCAIFGNSDDIYGTVTLTYCAGDDANFDSGTGNIGWDDSSTTWDDHFPNYATYDFHLASTSSLINAGTDLYGSGVTTDIDGDTLTVRNDIGADEYVAAGGASRRRIFIISKHEIYTHSDNSYCRLGDCLPSRRKDYKTV